MTEATRVVVVTGLSGAGKSTALHALEDLGFFCVDNLPPAVLPSTIEALEHGNVRRLAFGIDVRVRSFLDNIGSVFDGIDAAGRELSVLFLDASDAALLRRFSSTRRPHPLIAALRPAGDQPAIDVLEGVRIEREQLSALRVRATRVLDTTTQSVHDLRRAVLDLFGPGVGGAPRMHARFVSFGFKYGAPVDADLLFDLRFLQNPYFVPELKSLPGTDASVRDFVLGHAETGELLSKLADLLSFSIPRFEREGKSYLTVGFGCTGGRHRSVVVAERLAATVGAALGRVIDVVHRDVEKAKVEEQPQGAGGGVS
ncbi:MAG: RNase adapter RapZ [Myxococcales bacterium]|nr:RNase adapter RapZ [Myxococcales bacterium]